MPRSLDIRPGGVRLTETIHSLERTRPPVPVDNEARVFIFCCASAFLAIAGLVVTVVVRFLL